MNVKKVDLESYPRKAHFQYFKSMAYPYVGVTVNIDITELHHIIKKEKLPFFLSVLYVASKAANSVPELRRRINGEDILEYSYCNTSHTVALEDGTYCYCELDSSMDFKTYIEYGIQKQNNAKEKGVLEEGKDAESFLFVSSLPWLSYTSLIQPVPHPADSNPRITFGRFFEQDNKILLPTSILANHALVDGKHISEFYEYFNEIMKELKNELSI